MDHSDASDSEAAQARGEPVPARPAAPLLSLDELRMVVFVIRCARFISLLQHLVPGTSLPPPEDRIPAPLLSRLIRELKTILPRWTWTPSL